MKKIIIMAVALSLLTQAAYARGQRDETNGYNGDGTEGEKPAPAPDALKLPAIGPHFPAITVNKSNPKILEAARVHGQALAAMDRLDELTEQSQRVSGGPNTRNRIAARENYARRIAEATTELNALIAEMTGLLREGDQILLDRAAARAQSQREHQQAMAARTGTNITINLPESTPLGHIHTAIAAMPDQEARISFIEAEINLRIQEVDQLQTSIANIVTVSRQPNAYMPAVNHQMTLLTNRLTDVNAELQALLRIMRIVEHGGNTTALTEYIAEAVKNASQNSTNGTPAPNTAAAPPAAAPIKRHSWDTRMPRVDVAELTDTEYNIYDSWRQQAHRDGLFPSYESLREAAMDNPSLLTDTHSLFRWLVTNHR